MVYSEELQDPQILLNVTSFQCPLFHLFQERKKIYNSQSKLTATKLFSVIQNIHLKYRNLLRSKLNVSMVLECRLIVPLLFCVCVCLGV